MAAQTEREASLVILHQQNEKHKFDCQQERTELKIGELLNQSYLPASPARPAPSDADVPLDAKLFCALLFFVTSSG